MSAMSSAGLVVGCGRNSSAENEIGDTASIDCTVLGDAYTRIGTATDPFAPSAGAR
ncbi:hypothetical protein J2X34_003639 [Rhodococcus sp. BE178]